MNRRAVFLDVDGTLVNERGVIPQSARLAVQQARANGHLVVLCTGRSTSELWQAVLDVGFDGIIAAAGGYVELEGVVLSHHNVPVEDVRGAVAYFRDNGIEYLLESNSGVYGSVNSQPLLRKSFFGSVTDSVEVAELQRGAAGFVESIIVGADSDRADINKIIFLHSDTSIDTIRERFQGTFGVVAASVTTLGSNSGELFILGVNKGAAIEVLIEHLGIAREDTIAFGDGFNDLEMLEYVGMGIAMGNAHSLVREIANEVTGGPDEDGIRDGFAKHGLI